MATIINKQITLNGKTYRSEEELPESMRAYFRDDNKNGIPDTMEPLLDAAKAASNNSQDITISSVSSTTNLPHSPAVYQDTPSPVADQEKMLKRILLSLGIVFFTLAILSLFFF